MFGRGTLRRVRFVVGLAAWLCAAFAYQGVLDQIAPTTTSESVLAMCIGTVLFVVVFASVRAQAIAALARRRAQPDLPTPGYLVTARTDLPFWDSR